MTSSWFFLSTLNINFVQTLCSSKHEDVQNSAVISCCLPIMCGGSQISVAEIVYHPAQFAMDEMKENYSDCFEARQSPSSPELEPHFLCHVWAALFPQPWTSNFFMFCTGYKLSTSMHRYRTKFNISVSLYVRAIWQTYIYYNQHYAHDWSG